MSAPFWVLDTGALLAFAHGVDSVGQVLVDTADAEATVMVPLICLIEAYGSLHNHEFELLQALRRNPAVVTVVPSIDVDHFDECPTLGVLARLAGRLGAGHAAYVALTQAAGVITSRADQIHAALGDEWTVIEVDEARFTAFPGN